MELELFAKNIREDSEPLVTSMDGYQAMKVAHQVLQAIEKNKVA